MEKSKAKHLTDEEFYTFVKFRDLMLQDGYFGLGRLSINGSVDNIYKRISEAYGDWINDLPVNIPKGETFLADLEELRDKAKENNFFHDEKDFVPILDKMEKTEWITFAELGVIFWIWTDVFELIEFQTPEYKLTDEQKKELQNKVSNYLELFRNDELKTEKINFYRFDLQKKLLINWVEDNEMIAKYGTSFIISEKADRNGILRSHNGFSLIQIAYALEEMSYLTINDVWLSGDSTELDLDDNKYLLNINLDLKDQFLKELNKDYQNKNPTVTVDGYESRSGLLKFAGKEVFLIKGSKKTDGARLMETLLTADGEEWLERGDVFADWGMTKDDREQAAKNKIYFAKNAINDAVVKATGINDFIEGTTKRFRINPRYRMPKVDE